MDPQPGGNERNQSSQSQLVDHKRSRAQPDQNGADIPRLAGTSNMDNDQYCLRWNNYETNILGTFGGLLEDDALSDVTLFSEGDSFRAHRLVLSACSSHFAKLFGSSPFHGPVIVILDGTRSQDLHILLQFMYKGVAYLHQDRIDSVLRAAEVLQVKGLSDGHTVENVSKDGNSISDEGGASYEEDKNEGFEERDTAGSMEAVESPLSLNTNGTPGTSPSWTPHPPHPEETENGSQCAANIDIKTESNSPGSTSPHPPQSYSENLQDSQGEGRRTPVSTGSQDSMRTDDFQINLGTNDVDDSLKQETNLETFRRIVPASETNCDPETQFTTLHKMDVPCETNQGRAETNQCRQPENNHGRQPENNHGRQPENNQGRRPETNEGRQLETNQGRQPFQGQSFQNFQFPLSAPLEIPDSEVSRMVTPGQDISRKITRMVNPGQDISHEVPNFSTKSGTKLKCPFCDRTYGYDTNLRAHIRQCHQGIRVPCPFCHRSFTRNNTVRRHIAREHRHHINSSMVPAKFAKTKVLPDSLFQEYLNQSSRKFTIACQYFNQTFKSSQLDSPPKSISDQQTKFANMKLDRI